MKKVFYLIVSFLLVINYSCKDETIVNPPADNKDYFPAKVGAKFNYILSTDSSFFLSGSRISDITNTTLIAGTEYFIQIDSVIFEMALTLDTTYFRKSNTGVFYYSDTTGLSELIPDSLINLLRIDNESRLLFFPLQVNQTWPVYQIDFLVGGVPVFSPVKTSAKVIEAMPLNIALVDSQFTVEVLKIEYKLEVQLNPQGPVERYFAYGYIAENIGFVKWEGETIVLNLIRGGRIDTISPGLYRFEKLNKYYIP